MNNITEFYTDTKNNPPFIQHINHSLIYIKKIETQPQKSWFTELVVDFFKERKTDAENYSKNIQKNIITLSK